MVVILKFDPMSTDEQSTARRILNADAMHYVLEAFLEWLETWDAPDDKEVANDVVNMLNSYMRDNGIDLHETRAGRSDLRTNAKHSDD
jgi:hypothetical protein